MICEAEVTLKFKYRSDFNSFGDEGYTDQSPEWWAEHYPEYWVGAIESFRPLVAGSLTVEATIRPVLTKTETRSSMAMLLNHMDEDSDPFYHTVKAALEHLKD